MSVKQEQSYGIVPVRTLSPVEQHVFIVQLLGGHWSFPKGHPEEGEEPLETAERELIEETNLRICHPLLSEERLIERYNFELRGEPVFKRVDYFIAEVKNPDEARTDPEEIIAGKWVDINLAPKFLTFEEGRRVCREAVQLLHRTNRRAPE